MLGGKILCSFQCFENTPTRFFVRRCDADHSQRRAGVEYCKGFSLTLEIDMDRKVFRAFLLLCACLCSGQLVYAAGDAPMVAEVLFASGTSQWAVNGARTQVVVKGAYLPVGSRIETGEDGYVYLGTVDKGFLVLRPRTVARLARYQPDTSSRVDIRLELEKGVARVVSGAAAHDQPQGFRLETPLAVIGVRGTDFSVLAGPDLTQVTVRSGGVVVSPLSDVCRAGGIGPCEGAQVAELSANDRGQLVEVRRGVGKAVRLAPLPGTSTGPDSVAPPASEENRQLEKGASGSASAKLAETRAEEKVSSAISSTASATPATPTSPTIFWGRWSGLGQSDVGAYLALTDQGARETVAMNPWFAVTRLREGASLPRDGVLSLALTDGQALITSAQGYVLAPAQVLGGTLSLDFGQSKFQTTLSTSGGGYTADLRASGQINSDATFDSNVLNSNGNVRGAIEAGGRRAVYLFLQPLQNGNSVTGVTSWAR